MGWTEQQVETLKQMWGHGHSASEIAAHLGNGVSRNAVIGKAHRLKLSIGLASSKGGQVSVGGVKFNAAPQVSNATVKSARQRVMLRPLPVLPTAPISTVSKLVNKDATVRSFDSIKRVEGVAVTRAGERQCRWPVGDPRSPDFRFCGCSVYENLPYCVDHARVAYQSMGRKNRSVELNAATDERAGA